MKTTTVVIAALLCAASVVAAEGDDDPLPKPRQTNILQQVVAQLPSVTCEISGDITVRRRRGVVLEKLTYSMILDWGGPTARAEYNIFDEGGARKARMEMLRGDQGLVMVFYDGPGEVPTNTPPLTARVCGTDITWLDLTLDFLWWPDPKIIGQDDVLARECDVVVVAPPPDMNLPGCAGAKIWVEKQVGMMMRAEQIGPSGEPARGMWVRKLKKVDDRWIIGEMEVESYPGDHRTRLKVTKASIKEAGTHE